MRNRLERQAGEKFGLQEGPGIHYGTIGQAAVTLTTSVSGITLHLYLGRWDPSASDIGKVLTKPASKYGIRHVKANPEEGTAEFLLYINMRTNKNIAAFLETELPRLEALHPKEGMECAFCGQPLPEEEMTWAVARPKNMALPLHQSPCLHAYQDRLRDQDYDQKQKPPSRLLPAVGALLGGSVGCIPWVLLYLAGVVAAVGGFLIALCASFGHKVFGGAPGKGRVIWVLITIFIMVPLALGVGEIAQMAISISDGSMAATLGLAPGELSHADIFPLFEFLWSIPEARQEMVKTLAGNLALSYLFAGLGTAWAYAQFLRHENRGGVKEIVKL